MTRPISTTLACTLTVALLAGCAATTPTPTPTRSAPSIAPTSATPTVGDTAPAQPPSEPPTSADAALQSASKTITLYLRYDFVMLAHPDLGGDYLRNYVAGDALTIATDSATSGISTKTIAHGGPVVFTPDYSLSSTGVVYSGTTSYTNAIAYMIGCVDNSALHLSTNGASRTPATTAGTTGPGQFTVAWNPATRTWLVTSLTDLGGSAGAPKC